MTEQINDKSKKFTKSMTELYSTSQLWGGSGEYLDLLYEDYLADSNSVPEKWQEYFNNLKNISDVKNIQDVQHGPIKKYFKDISKQVANNNVFTDTGQGLVHYQKQIAVNKLIIAYRRFGHRIANIDPLGLDNQQEAEILPILKLDYYNLTNSDLNTEFSADSLMGGKKAKLKDIITILKQVYCNTIAYQYQYITNHEELIWLQQRIESNQGKSSISASSQKNILQQLTAAEGLEKYLHTKYVGQKRFSLEGGESLIVLLDEIIQRAGGSGYKEIVTAMAHRGRLNVLVNVLGKSPKELFAEFEGKNKNDKMSGDVKYHQGFSQDVETTSGDVHLTLAFNPSHLEIVAPVAQGSVKARQERRGDDNQKEVLSVSIHGDAAFAGQGVVMEMLNMSHLRGFSIGGTLHIVINNQVGFTTSDHRDTRSTRYCTDVAKMIEAPVFHVNGDDPEAVATVAQIALDYKHKFNKDVVIDLVCYRRHGHNEADEPSATQPVMYKIIKSLDTTRNLYAKKLIAENIVTKEQDQDFIDLYRNKLDQGDVVVANIVTNPKTKNIIYWNKYTDKLNIENIDTSYSKVKLVNLGEKISTIPNDFKLQAQVKKVIENRAKMTQGELPIDWGYAEMLSYASLLEQGYSLRLCGQDSQRGTFAHRHSVLHDQKTNNCYNTLQNIIDSKNNKSNRAVIIDSILSEEAVLAFEYGYSTTDPNTLTIWEAQFGDFCNGAQVVIDQFISSCEQKWGRLSGLVLLLPHGYEGMGPEHSSARLERFLQLCAQQNIQVCVPTTPAQVFHMLRRQMLREYRKPLIVMSPKSLLRHKLAVSNFNELATGSFQLILPETNNNIITNKVTRVILCSGKVYYDLISARDNNKLDNVAILRIEQLYPFPNNILKEILANYNKAKEVIWCQEEPKNQGAWYCSAHNLEDCLAKNQQLTFVGRESSSAPSVGYYSLHLEQQNLLVNQALGLVK